MKIVYDKGLKKIEIIKCISKRLILPALCIVSMFLIFELGYRIFYTSISLAILIAYNIKVYIKERIQIKKNISNLQAQSDAIMATLKSMPVKVLKQINDNQNSFDMMRVEYLLAPTKVSDFLENVKIVITNDYENSYNSTENVYYIEYKTIKKAMLDINEFTTDLIEGVVKDIVLNATDDFTLTDIRLQNNVYGIARVITRKINDRIYKDKNQKVYLYVVK